MEKQIPKICFVSEIIASELDLLNCLGEKQNICDRHPLC